MGQGRAMRDRTDMNGSQGICGWVWVSVGGWVGGGVGGVMCVCGGGHVTGSTREH